MRIEVGDFRSEQIQVALGIERDPAIEGRPLEGYDVLGQVLHGISWF
ncbi:MAG: hypothetical protein ACRELV_01110 [Longimicrobiales bacterium]